MRYLWVYGPIFVWYFLEGGMVMAGYIDTIFKDVAFNLDFVQSLVTSLLCGDEL